MAIISYPHVTWQCQRCAKCCKDHGERKRRILLTDHDMERIKEASIKERFCTIIKNNGPYRYQMILENGSCIFLSSNRCTIYNRRPLICRFYPFSMVEDGGYIFDVDADCLGVGLGKCATKKVFTKLVKEAKESL
ncbi:MAG: YkgJ family cysteine cluster protein [Nitrososphaeria archaeon]